jgi:hypothetical protein
VELLVDAEDEEDAKYLAEVDFNGWIVLDEEDFIDETVQVDSVTEYIPDEEDEEE